MSALKQGLVALTLLCVFALPVTVRAQDPPGQRNRYSLRYDVSGAVLRDGVANREYAGSELYRIIGREDLAAQFEAAFNARQARKRRAFLWSASGAVLAGSGIAMVVRSNQPTSAQMAKHTEECSFSNARVVQNCRVGEARKSMSVLRYTGWGSVLLGTVGLVVGVVLIPGPAELDPVLPAELQKLVDEANKRQSSLRLELRTTPSSTTLALKLSF